MDYERQIDEIVKYFKSAEKSLDNLRMGIEIEHFVIYKDTLETVSFYGEDGVESTLKELEENGWEAHYEGDYLLLLTKDGIVITLEPGSQLEFSTSPKSNVEDIESDYIKFLNTVLPILDRKNQELINVGYHPVTKIDDIKILPKKRYDFMFEYFKDKGKLAHNMMKGTASLQLAFDFTSEEDYIKKFRVLSALSPVAYAMFDNAFYFEGDIYNRHNLRAYIWENMDKERSGVVPSTFDKDFGYRKYAEYTLNTRPILMDYGNEIIGTGNKKVRDLIDPENYTVEELEHALTMLFPDVRTKKYVEVRMMDSVPYPISMGVAAFFKGLVYSEENMKTLDNIFNKVSYEDIMEAKEDIYLKGLSGKYIGKTILDWSKELLEMSKKGLEENEIKYLEPLERLIEKGKSPYDLVRDMNYLGKKEALDFCITELK